jgi:hypothetical protein
VTRWKVVSSSASEYCQTQKTKTQLLIDFHTLSIPVIPNTQKIYVSGCDLMELKVKQKKVALMNKKLALQYFLKNMLIYSEITIHHMPPRFMFFAYTTLIARLL